MTEPQTITPDHVRALLDADDGGTTLVLIEGRIELLDADQVGTGDHLGALEVISRDELAERIGDDPDDDAIEREAGALTTSVAQLGG